MGLFEDLERVKLRFIAISEQLLAEELITSEQFDEILLLLDNLDEYDQQYINQKLNELTDGKLELLFWDHNN